MIRQKLKIKKIVIVRNVFQKHDKIKNDYCKQKGINLLRLNNLKTVEQELTEYFKTYKINDI